LWRMNRSFFAGLLLILASSVQAEDAPDPTRPVKQFHDSLIAMMKLSDYDARVALLEDVIESTFDANTVARIALGRNWRKLLPEEQATIRDLMVQVIVSSYASRFGLYAGESFQIGEQKTVATNRLIIRTILIAGEEKVNLDYQLIRKDSGWKIFDVVANGVSDLSLKRATYAGAFKTSGINGVINDVTETIKDNEAKATTR